jgi:quercetin dioxygenase-like cupin family protein
MGPEVVDAQAVRKGATTTPTAGTQMNPPRKTISRSFRIPAAAFAALVAGLAAATAQAATPVVIGTGTMEYSEAVGGPATLLIRTLTIAPGELLGWHDHPGTGAYTIVVSGTLVIEDGCGTEAVYTQGQAFLEPPGRVHRGKNLTTSNVVTAQTFLVPRGTPTSVSHAAPLCGVPQTVSECTGNGWRMFDLPRRFVSQGDCIAFVIVGE